MESQNCKKSIIVLLVLFIISTLALGGFIIYDKVLKTESDNSVNKTTDNEKKQEKDEKDEKKDEEKNSEPRTYRFFGYTTESSPDMYTTLKLYSNGLYIFYTNECSSISKNIGNYSETNSSIQLSGDLDITLNKKDNGNYLEFDAEEIGACVGSNSSFTLESYILNRVPSNEDDNGEE